MKYCLFLLLIIIELFQYQANVVNSCGNTGIVGSSTEPTKEEDCKDSDEPACKLVHIKKGDQEKHFCAIIHGKYNDQDVLNDVKKMINADALEVTGTGFVIKAKPALFFILILFIFL